MRFWKTNSRRAAPSRSCRRGKGPPLRSKTGRNFTGLEFLIGLNSGARPLLYDQDAGAVRFGRRMRKDRDRLQRPTLRSAHQSLTRTINKSCRRGLRKDACRRSRWPPSVVFSCTACAFIILLPGSTRIWIFVTSISFQQGKRQVSKLDGKTKTFSPNQYFPLKISSFTASTSLLKFNSELSNPVISVLSLVTLHSLWSTT